MKATFASRNHALRLGKSLRDFFPGIPLATCQEWGAKILGYRDLHEMAAASSSGKAGRKGEQSYGYDEDAPDDEVVKRRKFQAEKLASLAKISDRDARMIIGELAPTARKRPQERTYEFTSESYLEVGRYMTEGDLNEGLRKAIEALKTGQRTTLLAKMSTLLVIQRARTEEHDPLLLLEAMELGSEAGWAECSYNLALSIASGWKSSEKVNEEYRPAKSQVEKVDRLYAKVIASKADEEGETQNRDLRSAAIVNRAVIVRDGLLTGKRDWRAAVALYEEAAELGNVVGAFNAGNVSAWLAKEGAEGYARRSAGWYRRTLDMIAAGEIPASHGDAASMDAMAESAKEGLAHLVMDGLLSAQGDPVLQAITADHEAVCGRGGHGKRVRQFIEKVKAYKEWPAPTPAGNWLKVLEMAGWKINAARIERSVFKDPTRDGQTVRLESVLFKDAGMREQAKLLVVWDGCMPFDGGVERMEAAVRFARGRDQDSYLMAVGRKALIKVADGFEYTPAWMARPGQSELKMVSIAGRSTGPWDLVDQFESGREFATARGDASLNYEFAIAVNTMDAGVPASKTWDAGTVKWAGVGGENMEEWRMPYYDALELLALGIAPDMSELQEH